MFYIFNKEGKCVCSCNYEVDKDDLASRNETVVQSEKDYYISDIKLENNVIVYIEPSLDEIKTSKLAELKATRNKLEIEPIEYNDKFFDYDNDSRDRISGAIIRLKKLGVEATISWTCADNTDTMVTYEDLENIVSNVADRANLLHIRYRKLRELVEQATTKEEVETITFDTDISNIPLEV